MNKVNRAYLELSRQHDSTVSGHSSVLLQAGMGRLRLSTMPLGLTEAFSAMQELSSPTISFSGEAL